LKRRNEGGFNIILIKEASERGLEQILRTTLRKSGKKRGEEEESTTVLDRLKQFEKGRMEAEFLLHRKIEGRDGNADLPGRIVGRWQETQ
jgi:hypothetical protein